MFDIKIQCEHFNGSSYSWFTIAEWKCVIHNARQLISLVERFYRIQATLAKMPEQTAASGNAVGVAVNYNGIGFRTKHSCYAGVTGVRLLSILQWPGEAADELGVRVVTKEVHETIEQWVRREQRAPRNTPDVAVMSNRQIAAMAGFLETAAQKPKSEPPPQLPLTPIEQRAERITNELLQHPSSAPPETKRTRRIVREAPAPAKAHTTRPPPMEPKHPKRKGKTDASTGT